MKMYVTGNLMTGAIVSYGVIGEPVPMPNTSPPQFFDPFEHVYVPTGCFKLLWPGQIPPDAATQYFDMASAFDSTPTPASGNPPRVPQLIERPSFDALNTLLVPTPIHAEGTDTIKYGPSIPAGTHLRIECSHPGQSEITGTIDDGSLELDPQLPGVYDITLDCWPFQKKSIRVEVS